MGDLVVVGVDGGGTKTDVCVVNDAGTVLGFATGSGSNWEGIGLDAVGATLEHLVGCALAEARVEPAWIAASAFCLAGIDWPSDRERLTPVLDSLALAGDRFVDNDSFAALRSGTATPWGCVSIAGTGGVAAARNPSGATARTMGIAVGEGAGAAGLVHAAVSAIAQEHNGSGPATALTERLLAATNTQSTAEFFESVMRGRIHIGGGLAVHVLAVASEGDPVARSIGTQCGAQHGRDTVAVANRVELDGRFDVVLAGGVHLSGDDSFRSGFRDVVLARYPDAALRVLEAPPVAGAALLALDLIGASGAQLHERVVAGTSAARGA